MSQARRIQFLVAALVGALAGFGGSRLQDRLAARAQASELRGRVVKRLQDDLNSVRTAIAVAAISESARGVLNVELDEAAKTIQSLPAPDLAPTTTLLPLNALHERILAVHGKALSAAGFPRIIVWKSHRYDAVPFVAVPPSSLASSSAASAPVIDITMMGQEYRADAFLMTNASGERLDARLRITNLPGAPRPKWLKVSAVAWTDTRDGVPVADALEDAPFERGAFRITIPAGMTCKVWMTVDSTRMVPGAYKGMVSIEGGGSPVRLAMKVAVSAIHMGRPRLSLGMWDYSNAARGPYGVNPSNREAAIASMQSHFVDSPWATAEVLPRPVASSYDADGALTRSLNFSDFDDWIRRWPGARGYYVFANVTRTFAGAEVNTDAFTVRVGAWGRALAQHASSLGLAPRQINLLLVDEPQRPEQDAFIAAWTRALKLAAPEIGVFEDPNWPDPQKAAPESLRLVDEICFHLGVYSRGGPSAAAYYDARRAAGKRLWLYQTSGPARLLDPTTYYRRAGWFAYRLGVVGIGFWAFGDTGGAETSWNEYSAAMTRTAFAPAFIGVRDVTESLHWEAVREGIEDYEYLAMLRDVATATQDDRHGTEARALIDRASADLAGSYSGNFQWDADPSHADADTYRLRILSMLEAMRSTGFVAPRILPTQPRPDVSVGRY